MDKKELTKLLHKEYHRGFKKLFEKNGFKKHKTNDYIKITEDDIVQSINIQKHSWDTRFTFNITVFPLFFKSDIMYYAFGGIRIGKFIEDKNDYWWRYDTEKDMGNSLLDALNLFQLKVFSLFEQINNTQKLYEYLHSENNLFDYKYAPENFKEDIGLLHLKMGNINDAYRLLSTETINEIKQFESVDSYLESVTKHNYEYFKLI